MAEEAAENDAVEREYAKHCAQYVALLKNLIQENPEAFIAHLPKKKVLDAGCGPYGSLFPQAYAVAVQQVEITYLDMMLKHLEPLRAPQERKVWANACQTPFENGIFDLVHLECRPLDEMITENLDFLIITTQNHAKSVKFKTPPATDGKGSGRMQYLMLRETYRVLRDGGIATFYIRPEKTLDYFMPHLFEIGFKGAKVILPPTEFKDAELCLAKK